MLITMLAAGSRGDIQPYLALGVALQKKGCTVRLATFENFEGFVRQFGLEFAPLQGDLTQVMSSDVATEAMQADNPLKVLKSFGTLKKLASVMQKGFYQACAGSDAILYHPGAGIGYFVAQEMKIPSVLAAPFPLVPTHAYPSILFYDLPRLGRAYNYLTHRITQEILWMGGGPIKEFWKQEFGRSPAGFGSPFPRQTGRSCPTIISCSDYVFPTPNDWPANVYNTGYWFLEDEPAWQPAPELLAFLDKGAPPVYVGFGSIGDGKSARQTTELVITALQRAGQRGVLATGWSGMSRVEELPEGMYMLESAPHSWLFPRMAAVVHHGGAGTTAAGLRAGMPGVIIPHGNDQPAWGRRIYELGVGAKAIPRKKLTAENLAQAIQSALQPEIRSAARELGKKIQAERGAERAAEIILNL